MIITAYVTQGCLSKGIRILRGYIDKDKQTFTVDDLVVDKRDWHTDWPSALRRAEQMKKSKIRSISRYLDKLGKQEFVQPDGEMSEI